MKLKVIFLLCAVSLVVAYMAIFAFDILSHKKIAFDVNKWKEARAENHKSLLHDMSDDLASRINSKKLSHREVIQQLGDPDVRNGEAFFRYDLGRHRESMMSASDRWWLSISFEGGYTVRAQNGPD